MFAFSGRQIGVAGGTNGGTPASRFPASGRNALRGIDAAARAAYLDVGDDVRSLKSKPETK